MKQSTSREDMHSLFDEDELEVADLLLNLDKLIAISETRNRFPLMWAEKGKFSWGAKRKRSVLDSEPPPTPSAPQVVKKILNNERDGKAIHQVKVEATSPATPLSFSPSESDEKPKHCYQKVSKNKRKEELLTSIKILTDNQNKMLAELENENSRYRGLLDFNTKLKAKMEATKQERALGFSNNQLESTRICHKREEPQLGTTINGCDISISISHWSLPHHQPFILDQAAMDTQTREQFRYAYVQMAQQPLLFSSNGGLGRVNHVVGPVGLPDFNVTAEENYGVDSFRPSDYRNGVVDDRTRYAEARRMRMVKRKEMRSVHGNGLLKRTRFR